MEVYLKRIDNLAIGLEDLLDSLSWEECINRGDTVLIKPNFCTHTLREGVTTNLLLLSELVSILEKRASRVIIGETHSADKNFDALIKEVDFDCEFINLSEVESRTFETSFGTINLPKIVFESKLVNVPVLKTHGFTSLTLGIKNLFGLLQDTKKYKYHHVIDELLLYLLGIVKPDINILDATYSMDGPGPTSGRISKTDLLLASREVVSLDMATCDMIGINPYEVRHISLASSEYGIKPNIKGDTDVRLKLEVPKIGRTEKLGIYLQKGPTRGIIMHPIVHPIAKSVRDLLKKL